MCTNAEPNYGPLWFAAKKEAADSVIQVLDSAKKIVLADLRKHGGLYQRAILRTFYHGAVEKEQESPKFPDATDMRLLSALSKNGAVDATAEILGELNISIDGNQENANEDDENSNEAALSSISNSMTAVLGERNSNSNSNDEGNVSGANKLQEHGMKDE